MRKLSDAFMRDLQHEEGILYPLLKRIHQDQTLMLAIRDGYLNIYYRGGNLVRISENKESVYSAAFDKKYAQSPKDVPILPNTITSYEDIVCWINYFGALKTLIDNFFVRHPKMEREFQQIVARVNNHSNLSNSTEYFITDIEFADMALNARFDLMGIRWLANHRKNALNCRVMLMEMKYGDDALTGNAGLVKHLQDFQSLIADQIKYAQICSTIESQFRQLDQLGLLRFNHNEQNTALKLDIKQKPEVIFLLANHNPRSTKLLSCLNDPLMNEFANSELFDLRFFVSQFAGYTLHSNCMVTLDEFRKLLK